MNGVLFDRESLRRGETFVTRKLLVGCSARSLKKKFMHVDYLASAFVYLIESYDDSVAVNVGTCEYVTIKELAKLNKNLSELTSGLD